MDLFHKESFVPESTNSEISASTAQYQVAVPKYGKNVVVNAKQTLLDVLEDADVPIVSICRSGFCGACICKVSGQVQSSSRETLTAEQIEQGYVLSCSATASSDLVVEI